MEKIRFINFIVNGERENKGKLEENTEDDEILFAFKTINILYFESFFI